MITENQSKHCFWKKKKKKEITGEEAKKKKKKKEITGDDAKKTKRLYIPQN